MMLRRTGDPIGQPPPVVLECRLQKMPEQLSVLHLLLVRLKPRLLKEARQTIVAEAVSLADIEGVLHAGAAEATSRDSTHSLALFVFLRNRQALDEFGAHPAHIRFLRTTLAPLLDSMTGADVGIEAAPPADYAFACCFGAAFAPDAYDWQVRGFLEQVRSSLGAGATHCSGLPLDERQTFRAAGVVFRTEPAAADSLKLAPEGYPGLLRTETVIGVARRLGPPGGPGPHR
jgi:hypothetical protein